MERTPWFLAKCANRVGVGARPVADRHSMVFHQREDVVGGYDRPLLRDSIGVCPVFLRTLYHAQVVVAGVTAPRASGFDDRWQQNDRRQQHQEDCPRCHNPFHLHGRRWR